MVEACRRFALLLILAWGAVSHAAPSPQAALELSAAVPRVEAWDAVGVLADPQAALGWQEALQRLPRFEPPASPRANLGNRGGAHWLHVRVRVPDGHPGRRMLQVDSAQLEEVDIWLVRDGVPQLHVATGARMPFSQRMFPSRAHAAELDLEAGRPYDVLVRVRAVRAIVPLEFFTPDAFHQAESREQLLQGVLAGLGLCLILYGVLQWLSLREAVFLYYSLYVAGATLLSYAYFGLGAQHLWPDNPGWSARASLLAAFAVQLGITGFTEHVLAVRHWSRGLSRALAAVRLSALAGAAVLLLGLVEIRLLTDFVSVTSPLMMLLAISAALLRLRAGDRAARWLVAGWIAFTGGMVVFIGLIQGLLPATWCTDHSMQFVSLVDCAVWMAVLGTRMQEMRRAAQQARQQRDQLHSLAHTDALTRLPNRRGLQQVLEHELALADAQRQVAIYLLDLDGFKAVNDRLGHEAGDELLVAVAQRLNGLLRASDTIARIGGDEFVVVAASLPSDAEARRLGQKLLDGIRAPFEVAGQRCEVGLTVGYVLAPQDGLGASDLLRQADAAMYAGKQAGRHCLRRGGAEPAGAA